MNSNKPYSRLLPPEAFGQPGRIAWAILWDQMQPVFQEVLAGNPVYRDNEYHDFGTYGDGLPLEMYYSYRFVPVISKEGKVIGMFNSATETTDQILAERRLATVRDMSEQMLLARTLKEYYSGIADVFEQNTHDAPFILCYSVFQGSTDQSTVTVDVTLESTVGVPEGHPSAIRRTTIALSHKPRSAFGRHADRLSSPTLSAISALSSGSGGMNHSSENQSWPIQEALSTRQCVVVDDCRALMQGCPVRIFDRIPVSAIVVPICSDTSIELPGSVLIIGLNIRRPFDTHYDAWIHVLRSNLASAQQSVKAREAEQKRLDDNAAMERAKSAWFRGAAHDLRSPLTLINGPLEDLLASNMLPGQKHQLMTAKRSTDRLLLLVNALMDFSRLEAGRVEAKFVPTDLPLFVTEIAELFRPAVERLRIQYLVQTPQHDQLVYIDPVLFETVVTNLIGNALKYTEKGSIAVRLDFGKFAEISVIDTGVGIPRDELGMVTQWYHRATNSIHAGTQGTGLGLALVKELLRLHNGDLLISSQTAEESGGAHGSTFTARVPLIERACTSNVVQPTETFGEYGKAVVRDAMRWTVDNETDSSSERGGDSQGAAQSRLSEGIMFEKSDVLMLVDNNLDMREYLRRVFAPYCTIVEAYNGAEALRMATLNPPNLILTDVMMPKMSGLELLAEMRKDPSTRLIPMVLISAMTGDEARVDGLMMGAEDYLEKPFKPKELIARVHLHMQVGKKRAKLERNFAEREAELALLSDYCPSAIMRADSSGQVLYANDAWRDMAGMSSTADLDSWPDYVHQSIHRSLLNSWALWIESQDKEFKITWRWQNGRVASGAFIRLDLMLDNSLSGILGCITDITHEEQRLIEAEQRRLEAEESKHQQELLIDLTSHEIRTPVSAILQCSSLVKENLIALRDQLKWSGANGFKPTEELLHDLGEDVEALESEFLSRLG